MLDDPRGELERAVREVRLRRAQLPSQKGFNWVAWVSMLGMAAMVLATGLWTLGCKLGWWTICDGHLP